MDPARVAELLVMADEVPDRAWSRIPRGFAGRPSRASPFEGTHLDDMDATIVRAPMISGNFALLDAAVAYRMTKGAAAGIALLGKRTEGRGPEPEFGYLRRYQRLAWTSLELAWILKDGDFRHRFDPAEPRDVRAEFVEITQIVERALDGYVVEREVVRSAEAERVAENALRAPLEGLGFGWKRQYKYGGFWRQPRADVLCTRRAGAVQRLGIEVKCREDADAPLSQVAELAAHVDAVIQLTVRGTKSPALADPHADTARRKLEASAPVRYFSI